MPALRPSDTTRRQLGAAAVLCALVALHLAGGDVEGETSDPDRTSCGSAGSIVHRGAADRGGELRADQERVYRYCLDRAHTRLGRAGLAGGAAVVLVALPVLTRSGAPRACRPTTRPRERPRRCVDLGPQRPTSDGSAGSAPAQA